MAAEWVSVDERLPDMREVEYSDGSGSYFVSEDHLVCLHEHPKIAGPWTITGGRKMRMAWVESDTADSEKQWYDAETGQFLPGVTHWLDGLKMPEGV
jgi:hypothetical protein